MANTFIVRDLLADAERRLHTIASARLDAEILLASSMQTDRASLYAYPERELSEEIATNFILLVNKRLDNYPVAYLTGTKEFWSLELSVNQHTLIPRPETECVVETALGYIPDHQHGDILDLGTGSGAIAIAIAKERPECQVIAVDLSQEALVVAHSNAHSHGIMNIEFIQSDWFSALQGRSFDVIIANPPYVSSDDSAFNTGEIRHEPRLALDGGHHGMQAITHLVPAATHFLKPMAYLVLEHGHEQAEDIRHLLANNRYKNIHSKQDYAGLDRLSFAQWP